MTYFLDDDFIIEADEVYTAEDVVIQYAAYYDEIEFINYGSIVATGVSATAFDSYVSGGTILNAGSITATGASTAYGMFSGQWCADITNTGTITVTADDAYGMTSWSPGQVFDNQGDIDVSGINARGLVFINGAELKNTGTITVSGSDTAYGVYIDRFEGGSFTNEGVIRSHASDSRSYGLVLSGLDYLVPTSANIINRGTIEADIAIADADAGYSPQQRVVNWVANYGTLIGDVRLGGGADIFENHGTLTGEIAMGEGNDRVDLRDGVFSGEVFLDEGDDTAWLGDNGQTVRGGIGRDTIIGGAGADTISGDEGNDVLSGGAGADKIYGGTGSDTLNGGDGDDVLDGDTGNDSLRGGAGADTLNGGDGDDFLRGQLDADTTLGGLGDDRYEVDNVGDQVVEASSSGRDWVYSSISYVLPANVEALTLTGEDWINATGNTKGNAIYGNSGRNVITGGRGSDVMTGKASSDTFVFTSILDSTLDDSDRITDLNDKSDKLDFRQIDGDVNTAGVQGFTIVDAFTGHAGELVLEYNASTDITALTVDVNGDGVADMLVRLNGEHESFDRFLFGGG